MNRTGYTWKEPSGELGYIVCTTRKDAIISCPYHFNYWKKLYGRGWRIVKVEMREIPK